IPLSTATGGVARIFSYTPAAPSVPTHGKDQTLHAAFVRTDTDNSNGGAKDVTITVTKATPVITWANPAPITYPTALGATQLNASADVPGTFAYTPDRKSVVEGSSGQTLHVGFTPTDAANYNRAAKDVTINVLKGTPVSTWA